MPRSIPRGVAAARRARRAGVPRVPAAGVPMPAILCADAVVGPGHHMCHTSTDLLVAARAAVDLGCCFPRDASHEVVLTTPVDPFLGTAGNGTQRLRITSAVLAGHSTEATAHACVDSGPEILRALMTPVPKPLAILPRTLVLLSSRRSPHRSCDPACPRQPSSPAGWLEPSSRARTPRRRPSRSPARHHCPRRPEGRRGPSGSCSLP